MWHLSLGVDLLIISQQNTGDFRPGEFRRQRLALAQHLADLSAGEEEIVFVLARAVARFHVGRNALGVSQVHIAGEGG